MHCKVQFIRFVFFFYWLFEIFVFFSVLTWSHRVCIDIHEVYVYRVPNSSVRQLRLPFPSKIVIYLANWLGTDISIDICTWALLLSNHIITRTSSYFYSSPIHRACAVLVVLVVCRACRHCAKSPISQMMPFRQMPNSQMPLRQMPSRRMPLRQILLRNVIK